jgi:hypothetical protein
MKKNRGDYFRSGFNSPDVRKLLLLISNDVAILCNKYDSLKLRLP